MSTEGQNPMRQESNELHNKFVKKNTQKGTKCPSVGKEVDARVLFSLGTDGGQAKIPNSGENGGRSVDTGIPSSPGTDDRQANIPNCDENINGGRIVDTGIPSSLGTDDGQANIPNSDENGGRSGDTGIPSLFGTDDGQANIPKSGEIGGRSVNPGIPFSLGTDDGQADIPKSREIGGRSVNPGIPSSLGTDNYDLHIMVFLCIFLCYPVSTFVIFLLSCIFYIICFQKKLALENRPKSEISPGDLIAVPGKYGPYFHFAIYVGNGDIVQLTGNTDDFFLWRKGEIKRDKLETIFESGNLLYLEKGTWNGKEPFPADEIVKRAVSKVGSPGYRLIFYNCEHFARWCRYDEEISEQANNLIPAIILAILTYGIILLFMYC